MPEFMELCRDWCDPGEVELREKEKGQFCEFVRNVSAEQTWKKISCENIIFFKEIFLIVF